jgi:hypothetical protein
MPECPNCGADEDACGCGYGACDSCGEEWDGDQLGYEQCPADDECSGSWVHWPEA